LGTRSRSLLRVLLGNKKRSDDGRSVAKSLQYKPENAKLIRRFSPYDYRDTCLDEFDVEDMEGDEYTRSCEALLVIVELSTQIREIEVFAIEESLLQKQIRALHQLRGITMCKITSDDPDPEISKNRGRVTINDVQSFIVHWPNLSDLYISRCNAREDKSTE